MLLTAAVSTRASDRHSLGDPRRHVAERSVFKQTELFSDVQFFGAQFGEVALFAVDLILLEAEVSR
jgi:hypothetical protein